MRIVTIADVLNALKELNPTAFLAQIVKGNTDIYSVCLTAHALKLSGFHSSNFLQIYDALKNAVRDEDYVDLFDTFVLDGQIKGSMNPDTINDVALYYKFALNPLARPDSDKLSSQSIQLIYRHLQANTVEGYEQYLDKFGTDGHFDTLLVSAVCAINVMTTINNTYSPSEFISFAGKLRELAEERFKDIYDIRVLPNQMDLDGNPDSAEYVWFAVKELADFVVTNQFGL